MGGHLGTHSFGQETFQGFDCMTKTERAEFVARRVDVEPDTGGVHRATSARRA
jgi:hypothetical protein